MNGRKYNPLQGSVPGHAPTHDGSNLSPPGQGSNASTPPPSDPRSPLYSTRFDQGGDPVAAGQRAKSKERQCMEAVQNGKEKKELYARFPPGMVDRLLKLQKASEDMESPHYIHANRLIREILHSLTTTKAEREAEEEARKASQKPRAIELHHFRADVPMPGAAKGE